MKHSKFLKGVGIVALSSVLVFGAAATMTSCKKSNATTLTVYAFSSEADTKTNEAICLKYQNAYNEAHRDENGFDIKIEFTPNFVKEEYFKDIANKLSSGRESVADVLYLAPKYVKDYANLNYVLDMSDYLSAADYTALEGVWSNAYSYYGYIKGDNDYRLGQTIRYDASQNGFVTADGGDKVGIYALPKDYSNFAQGFNRQFFTDELVSAYQTTYGSTSANRAKNSADAASKTPDTTKGQVQAVQQYSAVTSGSKIATYAAGGTHYVYNYDGSVASSETVEEGQEAPIIAIGIPVTYKPFNFYMWNSFDDAYRAGDPVANLTYALSGGKGFTVTLPGFPGQTFNVSDASSTANAVNQNAAYDSSIGHVTFTYQEYSAISWALTYYLNTFAWDTNNEGYGGRTIVEGSKTLHQTIYGGEQYEYQLGCELYLLPWLAANDVDFIDELATSALGGDSTYEAKLKNKDSEVYASALASTTAENRKKVNLDGTERTVSVQTGMNTQRFLETYAAYENHGAIWNANCGPAKDRAEDSSGNSGWDFFRQGRAIFYGAGSWDMAARNDADPTYFTFGQMPTPVAESYALYSTTPTVDYEINTLNVYSNAATAKGTNNDAASDNAQRSDKTQGLKSYTRAEVLTNQLLRQDKWAGRMDSVGYAINARLGDLKDGDAESWKAEAAAGLIVALTAEPETQQMLTYAGAQLPNFMSQCEEFLKYQDAQYVENGAFNEMITPAGFADTTDPEEGAAIWNYYYTVAKAMAADSLNDKLNGQTVAEWIAASGYGDYDGSEKGSATKALRYDPQYADLKLSDFTGESSNNYYSAMKVLRMVNLTYADRDLNIRMQSGLNAVRDSTMYTPEDSWLNSLNAAMATDSMLTYYSKIQPFTMEGKSSTDQPSYMMIRNGEAFVRNFKDQSVPASEKTTYGMKKFWSPAYYCSFYATVCDQSLQSLIIEYGGSSLRG